MSEILASGESLFGRFVGRQAFNDRFHAALATAHAQSWQHLVLSDDDFADWPLGERGTLEALNAWSHSRRTVTIYARSYGFAVANHHRFVAWRKQWQHIVTAWVCPGIAQSEFPSVLMGPQFVLQRIDPAHAVGICDTDAGRIVAMRERLDELQSKATPGFAASVLGL